jgi:hypothetical protein
MWWWLWSSWWNEDSQGKPKYSEKTCPSATLSTTNSTWPDLWSNPGRRGGKSATNRLSYGTPFVHSWFFTHSVWNVTSDPATARPWRPKRGISSPNLLLLMKLPRAACVTAILKIGNCLVAITDITCCIDNVLPKDEQLTNWATSDFSRRAQLRGLSEYSSFVMTISVK